MHYLIYKTTNNVNGKIYIGCHKTEKIEDSYLGSGKILKWAIKKYGRENFSKEIIAQFDNAEEMLRMESILVNEEFVKDADNYNLMQGGCGGWQIVNKNLTPEQRSENRINFCSNKCKKYTDEELTRIKRENGRKMFLEKRGLFAKKYKNTTNGFAGKEHTTKAKKKIGQANSKAQIGVKNSQYGTCWIYSLNEKMNKKINRRELVQYLDNGWIKGRKMKFN